ncbi:hypothetical protein LEADMM068B1_18295 [Leclercia adecarboxylata]|uniref:hypothetical protein n=1 Tax=Leclercia adecarboxylata TaxID=83655 RepID=UPI003B24CEB9
MNIVQHDGKKVTIDGSGGIYIAHHSEKACVNWRMGSGENIAPIMLINWVMHHQRNGSRLGRFFHLLPIIWKFTK